MIAISDTGMVRLYRMQARGDAKVSPVADWIAESPEYQAMLQASGRWFTDSLDEAMWYENEHPGGEIVFVDLPAAEAEAYRVSNIVAREGIGRAGQPESPGAYSARPEREFFLTREAARKARPLAALDAAPPFPF